MQLFSSWTGSDFVLFYLMLLGLATAAAWWIPANLRQPARRDPPEDFEAIAVLAGGRDRLILSVFADLSMRGGLIPDGVNAFAVVEVGLPASPAGKAVLAAGGPITRDEARRLLRIHADRAGVRLRRAGLLLRPEEYARLRWLSIAPFALLLIFGLHRQRAGSVVGEPIGPLIVLLVLTAVLGVVRFVRSDQRTAAGRVLLRELRAKNERLVRAPQVGEAAMAVALFGTGVLAGTPRAQAAPPPGRLRPPSATAASRAP